MPRGGKETAAPSMEIKTRMHSEFPWVKLPAEELGRTREKQDGALV